MKKNLLCVALLLALLLLLPGCGGQSNGSQSVIDATRPAESGIPLDPAAVYPITYHGEGFDFSALPVTFTADDLPLPIPAPVGDGFAGWFTDEGHNAPINELTEPRAYDLYAGGEAEFVFADVAGTKNATLTAYFGTGSSVVVPAEWAGKRVTGISEDVFRNRTDLVSVTLPDTLTFLGNRCFSGCTALAEINLTQTKLQTLGAFAFENCVSLDSATLPDTVKVIGRGAYAGTHLRSVTIPFTGGSADSGKTHLGYLFGATVNGRAAADYLPKELTSVTFTLSCREIREDAFLGCAGLTEIKLGALTEKIGNNAFLGCTGLTGIVLPKSVKSIPAASNPGNSPFWECSPDLTVVLASAEQSENFGIYWDRIAPSAGVRVTVAD